MKCHTDHHGKVFRCIPLVDAVLGCGMVVTAVIIAAVMIGEAPCARTRLAAENLTGENAYLRHVEAERAAILGLDDPIGPAARMARFMDSLQYESYRSGFTLVSKRQRN